MFTAMAVPETAVLQTSRFVSRVPYGSTIDFSKASNEYAFDWRSLLSGVSLPGDPTTAAGCGSRNDSVFHASGYCRRKSRRYIDEW